MFNTLGASLQRVFAGRRRWSVPSVCAICAAWPAEPFCADCVARFAMPRARCLRCAVAIPDGTSLCGACGVAPPPLDHCSAALGWQWPWSDCIARFKFGHEPGWATPLAALLRRSPGTIALLQATDLLLPLPLAPQRLRERGFNQSLELARRLAPSITDATLLLRVRHRAPQASLDRAARLGNLRGAFVVDRSRGCALAGRRVTLLDDVMTTGTTLFEAARTVRAAGAAHVAALVLARTDETT